HSPCRPALPHFRPLTLSSFSILPRPPRSPLFPYTTLFRSTGRGAAPPGRPGPRPPPTAGPAARPHRTRRRCAHSRTPPGGGGWRSEEHTSELQSRFDLVCRLLLEKKKKRL